MSGHSACTCGRKRGDYSSLRVMVRNANYSYFESPKGVRHLSDYSLVRCINRGCQGMWRTKAKYVDGLLDFKENER